MKHKNTYRVLTLVAALAVTASASQSCAKQEALHSDGYGSIGYSASIAETKVASGDLIENLAELQGKGFSVSAWYTANNASYFSGDKVSWTGSKWTSRTSTDAAVTRIWPADGGLKFLASTPASALATTLNTDVSASKWTYTHTVGTAPAADDLLFGYYGGTASQGTVKLAFHHPLALLEIRCGSKVTGISSISKVTVSGVYAGGTYTMNYGSSPATFAWTPSSDKQTITQTMSLSTFTKDTPIGESLPLIPQSFSATTPVTVTLQVTGLDGAHKTFVCTLNAAAMGSLTAGNRTTVSINIENADRITFEVVVTAWGSNEGGSADAEAVGLLSFDGVTLEGWQDVPSGELDL